MRANRRQAAAALATALLGVLLLSGTGTSYALWSDETTIAGTAVRSGELALVDPTTTIQLARPGTPARDVTSTLAGERLVPGDVVTVRTAVTVAAAGDGLDARLVLDTSSFAAASSPVRVTVDASGVALPPAGPQTWRVGADDGGTVSAVVTLTVPAAPATGRWGEQLQGAALRTGSLAWTLQQSSGTGWRSAASTAVATFTMDTLALSVTPTAERTATVRNGAAQAGVRWAPTLTLASTTPALVPAAQVTTFLSSLRLGYRTGAGCAQSAWTVGRDGSITAVAGGDGRQALAAGASTPLCLDLAPATSEADLLRSYAGRAFTVTTTVNALTAAPATWNARPQTWQSTYRVPFAQPTVSCTGGAFIGINNTELTWAWASGATAPTTTEWEIQRQTSTGGAWTALTTKASPTRDLAVAVADIPAMGSARFKVVAYPFGRQAPYAVESSDVVQITRPLLGTLSCERADLPNPSTPQVTLP
ncbi:alternate-type signal peptide domain-containing protein [Georgenia faecalis]|uniref:Alternate-type signal peptide domain-containing protein n=1 Tax=Georgenia faecalis TaxID=2483799 RepID=A0ABV9D5T5_9MICO|nr:alternate-type signal peptide domain-containing protein [Georgenia faecalis]